MSKYQLKSCLKRGDHSSVYSLRGTEHGHAAVWKTGNGLSIQRDITFYQLIGELKTSSLKNLSHIPTPIHYTTGENEVEQFVGSNFLTGVILPQYGLTLDQFVARNSNLKRKYWLKKWGMSLYQTLKTCYEHGINHNDLRPGNIVLDSSECPHIIDWGRHTYLRHDLYNYSFCNPSVFINKRLYGWEATVYSLQKIYEYVSPGVMSFSKEPPVPRVRLSFDPNEIFLSWWNGDENVKYLPCDLEKVFRIYRN